MPNSLNPIIQEIKDKAPYAKADDLVQFIFKNIDDFGNLDERNEKKISTMKLQKLLYYCQAWSIAKNKRRMFPEMIEAWHKGNVLPEIFHKHQGKDEIYAKEWIDGNASNLNEDAKDIVMSVLKTYGKRSGEFLSDLNHSEEPWKKAFNSPGKEVTIESMYQYFSR